MDERERSLEEIFSRFAAEGEAAAAKARVPFKFLDPYEAEDREIFFGREEEVKELYRKYHSAPLLLIYGESGTGKTSLLRCGLLAQIPSSDVLLVHVRNSAAPLETLQIELSRHPVDFFEGLLARDRVDKAPEPSHPIPVQQPSGGGPGMTGTLLEQLRALYRLKRKPITLLFDQLEELFIFGGEEERQRFLKEAAAWLASDVPIKVVLVIRKEYLADLTAFESVLPSLFQNRVWVRKMDASQAEEAIAGPCRVCGVGIERELVKRLLKHLQAEGNEVELPDLQVLMDRLYKKAAERDAARPEIKLEDYEKLGRMENILADFLNEQVGALPDPELGKKVLKLMVTAEGTKKAITEVDAVGAIHESPQQTIRMVLQTFERARILRRRPDGLFELRHDALAGTIYSWMSELEKEIVELHQLVQNRYTEFTKRGTLLDAEALELVAPYLSRIGLSAEQRAFFHRSRDAAQKTAKRRRIIAAAVVATAFLILAAFTGWSLWERHKAGAARRFSDARYLYSRALVHPESPEAAACLAASLRTQPISEARSLANEVFWNPAGMEREGQIVLEGHKEKVNHLAFSPDGILLATASWDGEIRLWNLRDGSCRVLKGKEQFVNFLAFSPDGKYIASYSMNEKAIRLWTVGDGSCKVLLANTEVGGFRFLSGGADMAVIAKTGGTSELRILDLSSSASRTLLRDATLAGSFDLSGDGRTIGCATERAFWLVDAETGQSRSIPHPPHPAGDVVLDPDGKWALVAGKKGRNALFVDLSERRAWEIPALRGSQLFGSPDGGCAGTWETTPSGEMLTLWYPSDFKSIQCVAGARDVPVTFLAFSPDGATAATSSWDRTVRLWDVREGWTRILRGHQDYVNEVAFSPDGRLLASCSDDKTVRLWRMNGPCFPNMAGHYDRVMAVAFSPDGKKLASVSMDSTVRLWDTDDRKCRVLEGASGKLQYLAYSPDGNRIAAAGREEKSVWLWDAQDGKCTTLAGHESGISDLLFSPDGRILASASADKTVRLWDMRGGSPRVLSGHQAPITDIACSLDGRFLASGAENLRLWDLRDGTCRIIPGEADWRSTNSIVFSPDSRLLAVAPAGTLAVYDVPSAKQLCRKDIGTVRNYDLRFSPDGRLLAMGTYTRELLLFAVETWEERALRGHELAVDCLSFTPDSSTLSSVSWAGDLRLWDVKNGLSRVLKPFRPGFVFTVAFSPDGRQLASASAYENDRTVALWRDSSHLFPGHMEPVWLVGAAITNEELIAALDHTNNLRYDAETDTIRPLPFTGVPEEWLEEGHKP